MFKIVLGSKVNLNKSPGTDNKLDVYGPHDSAVSAPHAPIFYKMVSLSRNGVPLGWPPAPGMMRAKATRTSPQNGLFSGPLQNRLQVVPEGAQVLLRLPLVPDSYQNVTQNGAQKSSNSGIHANVLLTTTLMRNLCFCFPGPTGI